jgi:hypothetical protein
MYVALLRSHPSYLDQGIQSKPRSRSGRPASTPKWFSEQSRPEGDILARLNQLFGNSFRESVMYLPQKAPSERLFRRQLRFEIRIEAAADWRRELVAISLLHPIVHHDELVPAFLRRACADDEPAVGRSQPFGAADLERAFARGEIQKDEYADKRAALLSGG